MDVLVKVSGDLLSEERFYDWLPSVAGVLDKLFIVCGGGTKITEVLKKNRISFTFGPLGRIIKSRIGRRLALKVLQEQKAFVEEKLREKGIVADVDIPVKIIGGKICHINGDNYAIDISINFDKVFIVTSKGKEKTFPEDLNIEVVHL